MAKIIAYCGIDCANCDAYIATQANDLAAQERVLAKWQKEYNSPNMTLADLICDSCLENGGRKCSHCSECSIRACAISKGLPNCGHCADFATCKEINEFMNIVPEVRANLEA